MGRAFDRVLLARHFALSVGAIAAYLFRAELAIGYVALWVVGISATLNFLAYAFGARPSMTRICMAASPVIGVGGWTLLVAVTGGIASPFIPGLWLEIMLSAMSLNLASVFFVTLGSVTGLWWQQAWLGLPSELQPIVLQSGFMVGMGLATILVTRRWIQRQSSMLDENDARVGALTRELEEERTVAALGENVARLAHGIKNGVHSLRGFGRLIEGELPAEGPGASALAGLRSAIDDLEGLARTHLGSETDVNGPLATGEGSGLAQPGEGGGAAPLSRKNRGASGVEVPQAIEQALAEIIRSHSGVAWDVELEGTHPAVTIPRDSLSETLVILLRNAVEAMEGQGRAVLETIVSEGFLRIRVVDQGPGLEASQLESIFKPGFTTKPTGSGYGLFLARRIAEEHGGSITARAGVEKGAVFELRLPVVGAAFEASSQEGEAP
ncbi:MAG: HAMP domain-containing sensor histidine kinase [Myxococcota bacterium]|nr:HAMP domain-containing sensor histidine kinase [Myxococcota bacterium]